MLNSLTTIACNLGTYRHNRKQSNANVNTSKSKSILANKIDTQRKSSVNIAVSNRLVSGACYFRSFMTIPVKLMQLPKRAQSEKNKRHETENRGEQTAENKKQANAK